MNDAVLLPLLAARSRWMIAIAYRYSDGRSTGRPCLCQSIRSSCSLPSIKAGRWTWTWTNVRTLEIDLLLFAVCTHGIYLCSRAVLPALISPADRLCKSYVMGKHDQVTLSLTHTVCGLRSPQGWFTIHPLKNLLYIHISSYRSIYAIRSRLPSSKTEEQEIQKTCIIILFFPLPIEMPIHNTLREYKLEQVVHQLISSACELRSTPSKTYSLATASS